MKNLIGNEWKDSYSKDTIEVINPYKNLLIDRIPNSNFDDVNEAVSNAYQALDGWRNKTIYERGDILIKFKNLVIKRKEELVRLYIRESGKPIREAREEFDALIEISTAFVEKSRHMYEDSIPSGISTKSNNTLEITSRYPLGIVAAILPSDCPILTFAHKIPAALIMGNTVIVKPSHRVPLTITKLVYLLRSAGVETSVIQLIHGTGEVSGKALASHPDINLITFSGSTVTGMKVMQQASNNLTKVHLELGGNNAAIVCSDADINLAVDEIIKSRIINSGQSATACKRILVHESIKSEFLNRLIREIDKLKIASPFENDTDMTCLIDEKNAIKVEKQVKKLVDNGAVVMCGGKRRKNFYEPTVITDFTDDKRILSTLEINGPIFPVITFKNTIDAIEIVNSSPYGLGASVFTKNIKTAFKISKYLDCGTVVINGSPMYRSHEMPFGGWKYSGFSTEGVSKTLEDMSTIKTTVLKDVYK